MKDKEKITTELKSTVKNLKIGSACLALESCVLVGKVMDGNVKGTLISLGLIAALGFIVHCGNKEFNESISEINETYDEYMDLVDKKDKTNDSEKENNGNVLKRTIKHREQL